MQRWMSPESVMLHFFPRYHPQSGHSNVQLWTGSCASKNNRRTTSPKYASASSMTRNVSLDRYRLLKRKPPFLGPILLITVGPLVHWACRPRLTLTHTSGLPLSLSVKLVHSYHLTTVDCIVSTKRGSRSLVENLRPQTKQVPLTGAECFTGVLFL